MDALRKHQAVVGGCPGQVPYVGHVGTGCVDDESRRALKGPIGQDVMQAHPPATHPCFGGHHINPVGDNRPVPHGLQRHLRDETSVVVYQEIIGILDAPPHHRSINRRL